MQCAIVICLCALMLVGISEARSLDKANIVSKLRTMKVLSQLKSRNINLVKKGQDESESTQDEDEPYSLIGLHVMHYVSQCISDSDLMETVNDEAWKLLKESAEGNEGSFVAFQIRYQSEDYFPCLWTASKMFSYENESGARQELDEYFTMHKEADKCKEMADLEEKFSKIEDLPEYVKIVTGYMNHQCSKRIEQQEANVASSEDLFPTAVFDAFSYVGYCLVSGEKMDETCQKSAEGVKNYAYLVDGLITIYSLAGDYLEEIFEKDEQALTEEEKMVKAYFLMILYKIHELESIFEHYNKKYTCIALKESVRKSVSSRSLSNNGEVVTGRMSEQIRDSVKRECQGFVDFSDAKDVDNKGGKPDEGKSKGGNGIPDDDNEPPRRQLQPINEKMDALKKILRNILEKK